MINAKNEEVIKPDAKILKSHHIFNNGALRRGDGRRILGEVRISELVHTRINLRQKSYAGPYLIDKIR